MLHMHKQGYQIWGTQWRNDVKLQDINRVDFYDFRFQQVTPINVTLKPGDRLSLHCIFKQNPIKTTSFGLDSDTEMCLHLLLYYPKFDGSSICSYAYDNSATRNYTNCNGVYTGYNPTKLDPAGGEFKTFGSPHIGACPLSNPITEILYTQSQTQQTQTQSSSQTQQTQTQSSSQTQATQSGTQMETKTESSTSNWLTVNILLGLLLTLIM